MATKSIRNKLPQAVPIQYYVDNEGLALYILPQRSTIYADETRISQYIQDLADQSILEIASSSHAVTTGFDSI